MTVRRTSEVSVNDRDSAKAIFLEAWTRSYLAQRTVERIEVGARYIDREESRFTW